MGAEECSEESESAALFAFNKQWLLVYHCCRHCGHPSHQIVTAVFVFLFVCF